MRKKTFGSTVAVAAAGIALIAAVPANAAPAHSPKAAASIASSASTSDVERGSTGCFNWSYSSGISTTTVYYHNTCSTTHYIGFQFYGDYDYVAKVAGGKHGHWELPGEPGAIKQASQGTYNAASHKHTN